MKSASPKIRRIFITLALAMVVSTIVPASQAFGVLQQYSESAAAQPAPNSEFVKPDGDLARPPVSDESMAGAQSSMAGSSFRAAGSMIFILALILAAVVLLKKYMPHRFGPLGHKRRIQVLETIPIGEKRSLTLVEIDGAALLLASTPGSVSLIKEIGSPDAISVENRENAITAAGPGVRKFADTLAAEMESARKKDDTPLSRLVQLRRSLEAK